MYLSASRIEVTPHEAEPVFTPALNKRDTARGDDFLARRVQTSAINDHLKAGPVFVLFVSGD